LLSELFLLSLVLVEYILFYEILAEEESLY
jgi:hypothetical protein